MPCKYAGNSPSGGALGISMAFYPKGLEIKTESAIFVNIHLYGS
jgi:hypothetical protein